jgi:dephospho-CoA kinase
VIIGLTGRNAAGKGTVADWLVAHGFRYTSLSDAIRDWLRAQGLEPSRDNLIQGGRTLRSEGGPGVLAVRTLAGIAAGEDVVVDSIRNPAEVEALRARPDFVLVEVFADRHVRWERLAARGRAGDARNFEEFARHEDAELTSGDPSAQQLVATAALADLRLDNGGERPALEAALDGLLRQWRTRQAAARAIVG